MKKILVAILKILGFLLILPLVAASFVAFQNQILSLPANKEVWVLWGAGSYVALKLFVYDFKSIYTFGNSLVEKVLTSIKPSGYLVPIYSIFLIVVYVIVMLFGRGVYWQPYFLFAISFTLAMHLVLTAGEIYESDESVLKAHYLLTFGAVLIISLFLMSLLLAWAIPEYSLIGFIKSLAAHTAHFYKSVYRALFVDSAI